VRPASAIRKEKSAISSGSAATEVIAASGAPPLSGLSRHPPSTARPFPTRLVAEEAAMQGAAGEPAGEAGREALLRRGDLAEAADDDLGARLLDQCDHRLGHLLGRVDRRRRLDLAAAAVRGVLEERRVDHRGQDGADLDAGLVQHLLPERLRQAADREFAGRVGAPVGLGGAADDEGVLHQHPSSLRPELAHGDPGAVE
jgi:hypothetical protein